MQQWILIEVADGRVRRQTRIPERSLGRNTGRSEYQGNPCPGLANGPDTSPAYDGKQISLQMTQGVNEQPDTLAIDAKTEI